MQTIKEHRITKENDIYFKKAWEIYTEAFPLVEQRTYEDHVEALKDESFFSCAYLNQADEVVAILFYWELEKSSFAEFYALDKKFRSMGLGTQILKNFFLSLPKTPVLEIEKIVDEQTQRRWKFYEKLGFCFNEGVYTHPPYQEGFEGFDLHILSYQRKLNAQEYAFFIDVDKQKPLTYTFNRRTT